MDVNEKIKEEELIIMVLFIFDDDDFTDKELLKMLEIKI